jgi:hypothetical protein
MLCGVLFNQTMRVFFNHSHNCPWWLGDLWQLMKVGKRKFMYWKRLFVCFVYHVEISQITNTPFHLFGIIRKALIIRGFVKLKPTILLNLEFLKLKSINSKFNVLKVIWNMFFIPLESISTKMGCNSLA